MKIFETKTMQLAKQALDVYAKQHEAIAKNVANVNNPDYVRQNTDFSKYLQNPDGQVLKTTNTKHIPIPSPQVPISKSEREEKVDITREMGELAVNQIRFDFVSRALARMYKGLEASIIGRSR